MYQKGEASHPQHHRCGHAEMMRMQSVSIHKEATIHAKHSTMRDRNAVSEASVF